MHTRLFIIPKTTSLRKLVHPHTPFSQNIHPQKQHQRLCARRLHGLVCARVLCTRAQSIHTYAVRMSVREHRNTELRAAVAAARILFVHPSQSAGCVHIHNGKPTDAHPATHSTNMPTPTNRRPCQRANEFEVITHTCRPCRATERESARPSGVRTTGRSFA